MENCFSKSKSHKHKFFNGEEEELYCFTYDASSEFHETSETSISLVNYTKEKHSPEAVKLSLEVEIADSLKHIITSSDNHSSELLDVTIVRPSNLNCISNLQEKPVTYKSNQFQHLLATMEREKYEKRKLIEECKKRVASNKMKPILEICETPSENSSQDLIKKHGHKYHHSKKNVSVGRTRPNIAVMSAPIAPEHKKEKKTVEHKKVYANSSISMLKPLVGEVRQSLKNLEARIVQAGDQKRMVNVKQFTNPTSSSFSSDSAGSNTHEKKLQFAQDLNTQQVYAAASPYTKIRKLLACQNDKQDHSKDKPCMCQHCGMVGLLVESQKRPIIDYPAKRCEPSKEDYIPNTVEISRSRTSVFDHNTIKILNDINYRLEALELRMSAQEHRAVRKSYFRRIIGRLLNSEVEEIDLDLKDLKNVSTQYSKPSSDRLTVHRTKHDYSQKQRTSRIHHQNKSVYCVCPVSVSSQKSEAKNVPSTAKKTYTNKAITTINDFFSNFSSEKEELYSKKSEEVKDKSFWRWGEEIIKPGFDLKTKIMNLLEEQFSCLIGKKVTEDKSCSTKRSLSKVKIFRNNATSAGDLFEDPLPYEDKDASQDPTFNKSQTLKHVLDLMSEKIYNDHVKPTVNAMKEEQITVNNENTKQIYNIRAAVDKAFNKLSTKQVQVSTTIDKQDSCVGNNEELPKPPLSLRKKSTDSTRDFKYPKAGKSGIPVRIITNSTISNNVKCHHNERKVQISPTCKKLSYTVTDTTSTKESDRNYNNQNDNNPYKLKQFRKPENNDSSSVRVTYKSPRVAQWNEESSASLPEEIQQLMFGSNPSKVSCKYGKLCSNAQQKRVADTLSLTDKLAFLTNMTSAEMGKTQLWNNIWKQAKTHCKSNEDTIIIQVPTNNSKTNEPEVTEVEFTMDEIQRLMNGNKEDKPISKECKNRTAADSFLLIRSKKILDEVHKKVGASLNKAS